jgi:two-component system chemotaxis response regulator CheY
MAAILVVDDSKFMRKMLSDILTEDGHDVVGEAENAREALDSCDRLNPDVVTMDIVMPEMDGIDSISALKTMSGTFPPTKVVMVSAMGQEKVMEECRQSGARDFITKPFRPEQIKEVVDRVSNSD